MPSWQGNRGHGYRAVLVIQAGSVATSSSSAVVCGFRESDDATTVVDAHDAERSRSSAAGRFGGIVTSA